MTARRPRLTAVTGVFGATLTAFFAAGAVLPVLPRYVRGPIHGTALDVGIVIGSFAVTAVVLRPLAGRLADRRGRRRVLLAGLVTIAGGGALLFLPGGVLTLIIARLVLGAGEGLLFTSGTAWVIDLAPEDRRGQVIGLFGLAVWGGLTIGPPVGEALYGAGGYDLVWAVAALAPLAGIPIALPLPDHHKPVPAAATGPLLPRAVVAPGFALALANAGYGTMASFLVLHLADRGIGHGALVFTAFAGAVVTTRLLGGRAPDRMGARRSAMLASALEAAGLAIIAVAGAWWTAAAGAIVMGAGFSMLYPALALAVVARLDAHSRGAGLGGFTAFFDIGFGVGAPIAGAIASLAGYGAAFWAGALAAAGAAVIAALNISPLEGGPAAAP